VAVDAHVGISAAADGDVDGVVAAGAANLEVAGDEIGRASCRERVYVLV